MFNNFYIVMLIIFSIIQFTFFIYQLKFRKNSRLVFSAVICSIATVYYFFIIGIATKMMTAAILLTIATFSLGYLTAWLINEKIN